MQRIQDPSAVAVRPAVPALTGTAGYFTNGNPAVGQAATLVPDWWLNMTQEELVGLLVSAGLALDGSASVVSAVSTIGHRQAVFSASANFIVPAGVVLAKVRLWGAGGGGGATGGGNAGGGGGGGGYSEGVFPLVPGASVPVVVGLGGTLGNAGTGSSFGALISATGGSGGLPGNGAGVGIGGAGGAGSGGSLDIGGGGGGYGVLISGNQVGGAGGGSFGASNSGQPFIGGGNVPGSYPGGGSSGQASIGSGYAGSAGLVIVEY